MYRDNTLLPSEAVRVLALALLAEAPRSYAGLASEIRHFSGRIVGPTLDLVGAPLEVLKIEGLVTARGAAAAAARHSDEALLEISEDGRAELLRLLSSGLRAPTDGMSRLIVAIKLRFLKLLPPSEQRLQVEILVEITERELVRLLDLRGSNLVGEGVMPAWLDLEVNQARARLAWYGELLGSLA